MLRWLESVSAVINGASVKPGSARKHCEVDVETQLKIVVIRF